MTQMGGRWWLVSQPWPNPTLPFPFPTEPDPTDPENKKRRELSALDCLHRVCQPTKHKEIEGPEEE